MKKRDSTDAGQLNHKPGPVRERYRLSGLLLLGLLHSPLVAAVEQCADLAADWRERRRLSGGGAPPQAPLPQLCLRPARALGCTHWRRGADVGN